MEGAAGPRKLAEGTMLDDKYRVERQLDDSVFPELLDGDLDDFRVISAALPCN